MWRTAFSYGNAWPQETKVSPKIVHATKRANGLGMHGDTVRWDTSRALKPWATVALPEEVPLADCDVGFGGIDILSSTASNEAGEICQKTSFIGDAVRVPRRRRGTCVARIGISGCCHSIRIPSSRIANSSFAGASLVEACSRNSVKLQGGWWCFLDGHCRMSVSAETEKGEKRRWSNACHYTPGCGPRRRARIAGESTEIYG